MLLDQQFPMERAFAGPAKILDRFGTLDPAAIAEAPPEEFAEICARPPAVHRFPAAMAARLQALAHAHRRRRTTATPPRCGTRPASAQELLAADRSRCPGSASRRRRSSSPCSASSLTSARPAGRRPPAHYSEDGSYRSVADVRDAASLEKVRAFKQEQKAKAKAQPSA